MRTFVSFEEARQTVLDAARPPQSEHVALGDSPGRTLAADIVSTEDIPPFDNSAMDGFAVRAADCRTAPVRLRLAGEVPAGFPMEGTVEPGACARIMTGAPIPGGTDAVVPVEQTETEGEFVRIDQAPSDGTNVRPRGGDVRSGERVLVSGSVVTPPSVGMLATLGVVSVPVAVRPAVAVISTGDEIVRPSETPGPGQIRNSNGPALAAQVVSAGGRVALVAHAPDDRSEIRRVVESATGADVILFSGGVSMGAYDYVRTELEDMGARWQFWKVRQRPGKPLIFGTMGNALLLGLPGNPVSSAVCFEAYARPLLARLLGREVILRPLVPARLSRGLGKSSGLYYFARGVAEETADGRLVADTGPQGSNVYSSIVRANCLIHLPEEMVDPPAGTGVQIEPLAW